MISRLLFVFLSVLLPSMNALADDVDQLPPDILVKQMVDDVLSALKQHSEITHDLTKIDDLVDARVLSHFDFTRLTQLTVGNKYWTGATSQERQQLTAEFHTFLEHVFSDVIAQYTDQTILFIPSQMQPDAGDITIKTVIMDPRDESTQLDFRMEKTDSGWLIYDVDIDNLSLIRIYHSNFSNELLQDGVPGLVSVLHMKNQKAAADRNKKNLTINN
jgi:phospholipid transport system substrate-binding protein